MFLINGFKRKKEVFEYYKENLANIEEIKFMPVSKFGNPNYWLTVITIDPESGLSPEALRVKLEEYNIESRPLWKPMHKQPVFSHNTMYGGEVSEKLFETGLCLPSGTALSRVQQDKVIEIIVKCLR
ncbi:DegT/DnrJ/EryC1/StrS family aminotransferase [Geitlerinema splendidum]|nr:DegT/DnrJ/EryC1/StrS family aminotransferase [Geitlerinema splendidum]